MQKGMAVMTRERIEELAAEVKRFVALRRPENMKNRRAMYRRLSNLRILRNQAA
jgi:hypothetical protein